MCFAPQPSPRSGRAPRGARGLKHEFGGVDPQCLKSRPTWGAWIETGHDLRFGRFASSRPTWGAWIETKNERVSDVWNRSRPTWGAWIETPNLKLGSQVERSRPTWGAWIETRSATEPGLRSLVAPHVGRVDRN